MDAREHDREPAPPASDAGPIHRRAWWVLCGLAVLVAVLFVLEHRGHVAEWLPWLVLLACPLMHVFMHGHHGRGHHAGPEGRAESGGAGGAGGRGEA